MLARGGEPRWSPDGKQIAFLRGNPADVYRINADGSQETRLTSNAIPRTYRPRWSPDGTKLLVERADRAHIVDAVTGSETVVGPDGATSADGRFLGAAQLPKGVTSVLGGARALVCTARGSIFAVDALPGRTRLVARTVAFAGGLLILNRRVVWAESAGRNRTRIQAIDLSR